MYLLHLLHIIPSACRIIINSRTLVQKDYIGILDFTVACNNMMNNAEWNVALCYTINSSYVITVEYTGSMEFIDGTGKKEKVVPK